MIRHTASRSSKAAAALLVFCVAATATAFTPSQSTSIKTLSSFQIQPLQSTFALEAPRTIRTREQQQPTSFYILRHGETDSNAAHIIQGSSDVSRLTAKGRRQALDFGASIGVDADCPTKRIDEIFVSPLTRARDTLDLVRQAAPWLPSSERVLPNLREIDLYSWENQPKDHLQQLHPDAYKAWKTANPDSLVVDGKKPLHETWQRAQQVWKEVREQVSDGQPAGAKLLVCHGTLGQALLASAFGLDATTFRQQTFPNCGMAEIVWHPDEDLADSWRWHT